MRRLVFVALIAGCATTPSKPNVVLILADDLGYGDVHANNPDSKIPTPHIDRLAAEGLRFTDAHAPAALCVPSRYGLLTGRYPFRQRKSVDRESLIEPGRTTVASLLRDAGYQTAIIGKWHQGFDGGNGGAELTGGPVDRGFDRFFGMHASLDIPPYFFIDGRRPAPPPTETVAASASEGWSPIQGRFWREGKVAPGFRHEEVLPEFGRRAVAHLEEHAKGGNPFFLYLPLTGPHTPWVPTAAFRGKSAVGLYGDFVMQVDALVGDVLAALDRLHLRDDTLVLFSSDNGPVWYPTDDQRFGHRAAGGLRGMKGDAWEGGHRMPFLARWPGHVPVGATTDALVSFTDVLATLAELVGSAARGEDSVSFLPALLGSGPGKRDSLVVLTSKGKLAVRRGHWKMIPFRGGGGFSEKSAGEDAGPEGQLYDLSSDRSEARNLWTERPEIVAELKQLLEREKANPPGSAAPR